MSDDDKLTPPPPLPPPPATAGSEVTFDDALTRPSALSDIAPTMPGREAGMFAGAPEMSPVSVSTPLPRPPARKSDRASTSPLRPPRPQPIAAAPAPVAVDRRWLVLALASALSLVVGLVIGAMLFGR